MADRKNRVFTSKEKISALREHHLEGKPISAVCEKHQIAPSLFYYWQKQFFENGEAAFAKTRTDGKQNPFICSCTSPIAALLLSAAPCKNRIGLPTILAVLQLIPVVCVNKTV